MGGLVRSCAAAAAEERLYGADLHGCLLRVVHSVQPRLMGVEGIVVMDSRETFQVCMVDSGFGLA